jgi:hypothetical protein
LETFLQRYQRGEHEPVWSDMLALGDAIRDEDVVADALAVVRETMRRARQNIEILIPRLTHLGYTFGYAAMIDYVPVEDRHLLANEAPPFLPPPPTTPNHLIELEQCCGPIPLALQGWYEQVGTVNFVGTMPVTWQDVPAREALEAYQAQYPPSETFPQWETPVPGYTEASGYTRRIDEPERPLPPRQPLSEVDLDPLSIFDLNRALRQKHSLMDGRLRLDLSPDRYFKYYMGGGGSYGIELPNASVDAFFLWEDGQRLTFVQYIRLSFQWGGFPGLAMWDKGNLPPSIPQEDIAFLREGLLPI